MMIKVMMKGKDFDQILKYSTNTLVTRRSADNHNADHVV